MKLYLSTHICRAVSSAIIAAITALPVTSQTFLQGTVKYFNSGSRPAVGVKISAFGANPVKTTEAGMFILQFPGKKPGDPVKITVGGTDDSGKVLELVNTKELEQIYLPANPGNYEIEVFVCRAGQRDEAAQLYYDILVRAADATLNKRLLEIERQLKQNNNTTLITSLQNEKDNLRAQRDSIVAKAEEQASYIANINLDKASKLVDDAVRRLDILKDVEAAIQILDNEMLYDAYRAAKDKKQKSDMEIRQVIEGFELKIKLLEPLFRNKEVMECCQKIETICNSEQFAVPTSSKCNLWTVVYPPERSGSGWSGSGSLVTGDRVEDFILKNVDNKLVSLKDYTNIKGIQIVFTSNSSPYSQLYEERIIKLHNDYAGKGFPVIAINSMPENIVPEDSFEEMKKRAKVKEYPFPYLKDEDQTIMARFGARREPCVFVIDSNHIVRYIGPIDDNPELPLMAKNRWVERAIEALLRGEKPNPEYVPMIGTTIKKKKG